MSVTPSLVRSATRRPAARSCHTRGRLIPSSWATSAGVSQSRLSMPLFYRLSKGLQAVCRPGGAKRGTTPAKRAEAADRYTVGARTSAAHRAANEPGRSRPRLTPHRPRPREPTESEAKRAKPQARKAEHKGRERTPHTRAGGESGSAEQEQQQRVRHNGRQGAEPEQSRQVQHGTRAQHTG